ncbi:MAG: hypothetical protein ACT6S0_08060 [Roseateles sp.]|uniref:hypothetical protein n=1 Tax=Roseateles sp. TaxID=1971397 RepID=UPI0040355EFD
MLFAVALSVVALVGAFLVCLGIAALLAPALARSFLSGFATTPTKHYMEMALRLLAGTALLVTASRMPFPLPFRVFGWVLVLTTLVLSVIPWRWHSRFAQRSVPQALRFLPFVAIASIAAGVALLVSALRAGAA